MPTRLAEMLSTRLCHDLTGPIGAVSNGAEFLEDEESGMQAEAMQLIVSSAKEAVNRMQFYRRAYGRVNSGGEADLQEQRQLIENFIAALPISLSWPIESMDAGKVSLSLKMARVLLNAIIIASGSLLRGGEIHISLSGDSESDKEIVVVAKGESIKLDDEVNNALLGNVKEDELTPKNVQAFFMQQIVEELGGSLAPSVEDNQFSLTVSKTLAGSI